MQVETLARWDEWSCRDASLPGAFAAMPLSVFSLSPIFALDLNNLDWGTRGFSYALNESHLPGLIVTGTLLLLFVISWSVMFSKLGMVGGASRKNYRFMAGFRKARTVMEPYEANFSVPGSPLDGVVPDCESRASHPSHRHARSRGSPARPDSRQWDDHP